MPQRDYRVDVQVQRGRVQTDSKGGRVISWPPSDGAVLYSGHAFKHNYAFRRERGVPDESGPGIMVVRDRFFEFRPPLPPAVRVGDRVVDVTHSETYRVKLPERRYGSRNLQLDCELVA